MEKKREKYQKLVEECQENGLKTYYDPIEVRCKGFVRCSLSRGLAKIGICIESLEGMLRGSRTGIPVDMDKNGWSVA